MTTSLKIYTLYNFSAILGEEEHEIDTEVGVSEDQSTINIMELKGIFRIEPSINTIHILNTVGQLPLLGYTGLEVTLNKIFTEIK
jgi:hypothetical protein